MAESSLISVPSPKELCQSPLTETPSPVLIAPTNPSSFVIDKTLGSAANLVKLLPCGTVIAFQALSPSFSNRGTCYTSNKFLTGFLIALCSLSCCFFSFIDSFVGRNGKLYYGIATLKGFYIFNYDCGEDGEKNMKLGELGKFKLRVVDFIHALLSCLVFIALAFGDSDIQDCFFQKGGVNTTELLINLPLGVGFLSSLVFVVFPTSRKGIGYSDTSHTTS